MQHLTTVLRVLRNKYVLAVLVFSVWITFCDRNDLFTQYDRKQELKKLEQSAGFYEKEIALTRQELTDLNNDPAVLEKLAREKFYLKRPNEEVFVVVDSTSEKKETNLQ